MRVSEANEQFGLVTKKGAPVPLTGVSVHGTITGRTAKVSIRQRFENREVRPIEAVYKFPLAENSSVCGFTVAIGDRVLRGVVDEREKAFETYDSALERGDGAYLLDEERPNIFTLSVGNVPPGHVVDIEVSYVTTLDTNDNEVRFPLPTTISPRYVPADMPEQGGIPVRDLVNPEGRLEVPYGLQLHLHVVGRAGIAGIECPSHPIKTTYADDAVSVEFSSKTVAMDRDFILTITHAKGFESVAYAFTDEEHAYLQVDFSPRIGDGGGSPSDSARKTEVIFVLDCSGSMRGPSIEQAKRALEVFLRGMTVGTRFNIYRFGSSFEKLFQSRVDYNTDNLNAALSRLALVDADLGGTELLGPLTDIYRRGNHNEATRNIVLLTDGQIGNEQQVLNLAKSDSGSRMFTVGIGYGPNEYLVKQLAALSGGAVEMVAPGERIEPKVLRLFSKVMKGAVEELAVDWYTNAEQAPLRQVVHDGECVSLFARVPAGAVIPEVVRLKGKVNGREMSWEVPVGRIEQSGAFLPLLWARARISDLEEGVTTRGGSKQENRREKAIENEVVALSKQYGILSRGTSFVTVESRIDTEKTGGEIVLRKTPAMLPRGWGGTPQLQRSTLRFATDSGVFDFAGPACTARCVGQGGFRHRIASREPASVDQLPALLAMQTAEGGFAIQDEHDADLLGLDMVELRNSAARMFNGGDDALKLLVTAVVLALLERSFKDRKDEWYAVTEKSRKWLEAEVLRLNPTVDGRPLEDWAKDYAAGIVR